MGTFTVNTGTEQRSACRIAASLVLRKLRTLVKYDENRLTYQPLLAIDDKLPIEDLVKAFLAEEELNEVLDCTIFCPTHDLQLEDPVAGSLYNRWMLPLASAGLGFIQKMYALPLAADSSGKKPKVKSDLPRLPDGRRPDVILGRITYGKQFNGTANPGTFAGIANGFEILDNEGTVAIHYNHGPDCKPSRAWSKRSVTETSLAVGMVLTAEEVEVVDTIYRSESSLHYLCKTAATEIVVHH